MNHLRTLLIVPAIVGAGCLTASAPNGDPKGVADFGAPADACVILGTLFDDELMPLAGVPVTLAPTATSSPTDASGRFSFLGVAPGSYELRAEPDGHRSARMVIECKAGDTAWGDLVAERVPSLEHPYREVHGPLRGRIGCALGAIYVATQELCAQVDPAAAGNLKIRAGPGRISAAVHELDWMPTGAFGGRVLELTYPGVSSKVKDPEYETTDGHSAAGSKIWGPPALRLAIRVPAATNSLYAGANMSFNVRPHGVEAQNLASDSPSLLVAGQSFELYATLFYNGAHPAQRFTALA